MYTLPGFPNGKIKNELLSFGIAPNSGVKEDESLPLKPQTAQGSAPTPNTAWCSSVRLWLAPTESEPLGIGPLFQKLKFQKFSGSYPKVLHLCLGAAAGPPGQGPGQSPGLLHPAQSERQGPQPTENIC